MKKILVLSMVVLVLAFGSSVAFAAGAFNQGNDTVVADQLVSKVIPGYDAAKPVYACSNLNGWCLSPEKLKGSEMVKQSDGTWLAKSMAGERFHPSQIAVNGAVSWAKLENAVPVKSTTYVDMSEGTPCILVKK